MRPITAPITTKILEEIIKEKKGFVIITLIMSLIMSCMYKFLTCCFCITGVDDVQDNHLENLEN
jgi:hypothetical protein